MEVYSGPYLVIEHEQENSMLINTWKSNPPNDVTYRNELIEHLHIVNKIKPSQIMWFLENLTFKVGDITKKWIDENISEPIFKAGFIAKTQDGFHQVAFVVGHDVLAYIKVIDIFKENSPNSFKPKCFATKIEAKNWFSEEFIIKNSKNKNNEIEISFKGTDKTEKAIYELKEQASNIDNTINLFKTIIKQNNFMKKNIEKYSSLTPREKETFKLIIKGNTNEQISDVMHISPHTIRTHRNRIWKKLDISISVIA